MGTTGPVGDGPPDGSGATEQEATFQLVPRELWPDPHPHYHRRRSTDPVQLVPEFDTWALYRWADCERVLRDTAFSSDPRHRRDVGAVELRNVRAEAMRDADFKVLLFMDPPDHTRIRRLVSSAFTPRSVERLRVHVRDLVEGMLDEVADRERFDLIADVGYLLPVTVICELMGVPVEDRHLFGSWSADASRMLDGDIDEATAQRGFMAVMNFVNYFNGLFDERRARPRDDLVSRLLAAEEEGDRLSETELRAIVLLLFIAGHETTTNLIGNGVVALLRHREQWDRLVADPDGLAPGTVEEVLRYDGPVHVTARVATTDLEVAGRTVEAGQQVICAIAAANRDPERFPEPDRLDIGRDAGGHLTFSHGIHYCLGAALARVEGQETFAALARRFPGLRLVAEPEHRDHFVLRGYREVWLSPR